jgi:hypothetical protein
MTFGTRMFRHFPKFFEHGTVRLGMRRPRIDHKVERVVLNALAKGTAVLPPNICA